MEQWSQLRQRRDASDVNLLNVGGKGVFKKNNRGQHCFRQVRGGNAASMRVFQCAHQPEFLVLHGGMVMFSGSTFRTSVGRSPSTSPSAASDDGMTTPGSYPASRKAFSYSSMISRGDTAATARTAPFARLTS